MRKAKHWGMTLPDSLCGLFLISLGLGLYLQTDQMINKQLLLSRKRLVEVRRVYEQIKIRESKK